MTHDDDEVMKSFDSALAKRIFGYVKPYKALFIAAAAALAAATAAELLLPVVVRGAIDGPILTPGEGAERDAALGAIAQAAIAIGGLLAASLMASFLQTWFSARLGQKVMSDLRMALYRHVCGLSSAWLGGQPVGRLVTRMTSDVETINEFFTTVVIAFLKDLALMAGSLATIAALSLALGGATVLSTLPIALVAVLARHKARDAFRRQRTWTSKVNAFLSEHIGGYSVVQLFTREAKVKEGFAERNGELLKASIGEMYVFATFRPLVELFSSASVALAIWLGAELLAGGGISLGILIASINLIQMFYNPVQDLTEKYTMLQSAMAGAERVFGLLDTEASLPDRGRAPLPSPCRGDIRFEDVRFSYKEGEEVLKGLTFSVRPGEKCAIVGYTGAGKTTIANLLTRMWDADSGRVLLDGRDVRDYPLAGLRRLVQPVSQDVFLFTGTVAENIALYGDTAIPVEEAARRVRADRFIQAMPEGYATRLSEGATNISSGQRQLISFARALAQDAPVIILDEATSSIDTETESLIQEALEELLQGRTAIVIAHRLSTIRRCDRILVLAGGRLVEEGSHDELMARGGAYKALYDLQYEAGR